MNKLALYVFPLGVVVGGPFLPIAIIIYWVSNNIWTFGQQHLVFGKIEKEEEAKKDEALARRASNAPAPGAKPRVRKSDNGAAASPETAGEAVEDAAPEAATPEAPAQQPTKPPAARNQSANRTPRPGSKTKKRKR